ILSALVTQASSTVSSPEYITIDLSPSAVFRPQALDKHWIGAAWGFAVKKDGGFPSTSHWEATLGKMDGWILNQQLDY
ncbi:hypothetical protein ILYODFUR_002284, partial [Ilyodon furcidens]